MQKPKKEDKPRKRNDKALLQGEAHSAMDCKYSRFSGGCSAQRTWASRSSNVGSTRWHGGQSAALSPLHVKASASRFFCPPQMWLHDVQMLCAASMGAVRDPRPAVISCWLFGRKVPFLLTVCLVLDHRSKVHGVQSSFGLIKLSFNFFRKDTHYLSFWRNPKSKFILGGFFFL